MNIGAVLVTALRRDRLVTTLALGFVIAVSWAYVLAGAGLDMEEMDGVFMPMRTQPVTAGYVMVVFVMWAAMMAAMMLPSAAPMVLLFGTIARRRREREGAAADTATFVAGYLFVWVGFSLGATLVQIALELSSVLDSMMQARSPAVAGLLLILAGVYQWSPLKRACLRSCRSPLDFLVSHWRSGSRGAFAMGLRHGAVCVGCCWALMLLLFVGGIMNVTWVAAIALYVLIEKIGPSGLLFNRLAGTVLVVWGVVMATSELWTTA